MRFKLGTCITKDIHHCLFHFVLLTMLYLMTVQLTRIGHCLHNWDSLLLATAVTYRKSSNFGDLWLVCVPKLVVQAQEVRKQIQPPQYRALFSRGLFWANPLACKLCKNVLFHWLHQYCSVTLHICLLWFDPSFLKSSIFPCLNIILLLSVSNIRNFLASERKNVSFPSGYSRNCFYFLYYAFCRLLDYSLSCLSPWSFQTRTVFVFLLMEANWVFSRSIANISSESTTKSGK